MARIIVVGGGAAGMTAASTAREHGYSIFTWVNWWSRKVFWAHWSNTPNVGGRLQLPVSEVEQPDRRIMKMKWLSGI